MTLHPAQKSSTEEAAASNLKEKTVGCYCCYRPNRTAVEQDNKEQSSTEVHVADMQQQSSAGISRRSANVSAENVEKNKNYRNSRQTFVRPNMKNTDVFVNVYPVQNTGRQQSKVPGILYISHKKKTQQ